MWVKIQEKESFSTAKEKLLILQLFWTNVVFNWRKRDFSAAKENVDSPVIFEPMWYLIEEKEIWHDYDDVIFWPTLLITIS